jgi:ribosomal protein S18 acetylase RimI-like enzyme
MNAFRVRVAGPSDAAAIGRLLHDFNTEYDEASPGPAAIAERVGELMVGPDFRVLLAGDGPDGLAVLRFRPALWSAGRECYLAELYVIPALRYQGIGRVLMDQAIAFAKAEGADGMDLNTAETDHAARALYEGLGFTNREGSPDGPPMLFYELNW